MNNIIAINRGDSHSFDLTIEDLGKENGIYLLTDDDVVYFALMYPHQPFEEAIFTREYTKEDCDATGKVLIDIKPQDTVNLTPGTYYYTIKLYKQNFTRSAEPSQVTTVINRTKFVICE